MTTTLPTPRPLNIQHFCAHPECTELVSNPDLTCPEHAGYFDGPEYDADEDWVAG